MKRSHVQDAAVRNLPPCPICKEWQGDPCRTPRLASRAPHKEREQLAREEAAAPAFRAPPAQDET